MLRGFLIGLFVVGLVFGGTWATAAAQGDDWRPNPAGTMEYNCTTVATLLSVVDGATGYSFEMSGLKLIRLGESTILTTGEVVSSLIFTRLSADKEETITYDDVFQEAISTCASTNSDQPNVATSGNILFTVVVNDVANLRACASTDCEVVGKVQGQTSLPVISVEDDWYRVEFNGSPAYIASWLTTRGPDATVSVDEVYRDPVTGCAVAFDIKRGDAGLRVLLAGTKRGDVFVDLYRPGDSRPLTVEGQLDKTFIDTGEPYVDQYYAWNARWPMGMYQLELKMGNNSTRLAWEMKTSGDYLVYVYCE